jgi:hypothetical protein
MNVITKTWVNPGLRTWEKALIRISSMSKKKKHRYLLFEKEKKKQGTAVQIWSGVQDLIHSDSSLILVASSAFPG